MSNLQVSLRKARQIERSLNKEFNKFSNNYFMLSIYVKDDDVSSILDTKKIEFAKSLANVEIINECIFDLRKRIGVANNECGLTNLINKKAQLEMILNKLTNLKLIDSEEEYSTNVIMQIKNRRENPTPPRYGETTSNEVAVYLGTNDIKVDVKAKIKKIKKQLIVLDEEILSINTSRLIEVPEYVVEMIEKLEIPY